MSRRLRSTQKVVLQAAAPKPTPVPAAALPIHLFDDASAWESWLETNHTETSGLWLKISKKGSEVASVTYEEALDTALCFGWIDGQRKSHDEHHFLQKFTPRRKNSMWSKRNVGKIATLVEAGRMRQPGQAEVDAAKADGRWQKAYSSQSSIEIPTDFEAALNRNKKAKTFFEALNKSKRYMFLMRIETAKRTDTRRKKIDQFVQLLAEHKTL
ncbi:bacteriocin-protection, YdeI or OmpD-associated-domain-containing protein [Apodospora peruviana]|uniref:Bacteriocin-protection, YdeI or OmpD-associated-domain-containing protein n=1 Tax=Apodospora peruviana TaxID=516989 RepID=A0AAE0ICR9_9PEZI|nr:bacteriocin-protection, YdeI or OmpD-associated-domain-containing protein [Apodospora peruviana]